jgi:NTE family protein
MKLGLGLSGGGYRAANLHLGVLDELHHQHILKYVDVISTVSGGSIIGAYWVYHYVEKYKNAKDDPTRHDIFVEFKESFIANVLKVDLVSKILRRCARPDNLFRLLSYDYSRTDVAASLYEEILNFNSNPDEGYLWGLPEFPKLIINATNLNNGKIWKFTRDQIGDKYTKISGNLLEKTYRVAKAVAASAAFPGGFPPIELERSKFFKSLNGEIKLSDGGEIDNLGVSSLVDEGCDYIIISDGGSPFKEKKEISGGEVAVLLRVIDIFQSEVREYSVSKLKGQEGEFLKSKGIKGSVVLEIDYAVPADPEWNKDKIDFVSNVETNLQALEDDTIDILVRRGVFLAKHKIERYIPDLKNLVKVGR